MRSGGVSSPGLARTGAARRRSAGTTTAATAAGPVTAAADALADAPKTALPAAAPKTEALKDGLADALAEARRRSLSYTELPDDELLRQHSPLMSPLVWDLAHVGNYEELWLLRVLSGAAALLPGIDEVYDPFRNPRARRARLPLLGPAEARAYLAEVRGRVLDGLDRLAGADADLLHAGPRHAGSRSAAVQSEEAERRRRLLTGGFVYGLVIQHEHQHAETMLATLQLRQGPPVLGDVLLPDRPAGRLDRTERISETAQAEEVLVPAGEFTMGTSTDPWAYDNERPAHRVYVPAFWIGRFPVTNRAYAAFIEDGGYHDERLWSAAGWRWRQFERLTARSEGRREGVDAPRFWWRDGGTWVRRRFGRTEPVPLDEPVQHVCWYEAEAYARWAGRRLPTEAEWEKACAHDPATGRSRRYPWGDADPTPELANLGHRAGGPAPVGAHPAGASPCGAEQMIGDVWEWTASDFTPYPGFRAFPYREYSEVFFPAPPGPGGRPPAGRFGPGRFKVLRGGSWATHPSAARSTFRNWDFPARRQIFAGFRLARDA